MLNFRGKSRLKSPPPRNYLARPEQVRLLLMIGSLGLVVLLLTGGTEFANFAHQLAGGLQGDDASGPRQEHVDTRLHPRTEVPLPLDTFIIPKPQEANGTIPTDGLFPGVKPQYFAQVKDNTPFRPAESDAFYHLLEILASTDQARLDQASTGEVGFVQLFQQPDFYRGKLVTLRGEVRRAFDLTPPKNTYGITKYYQVWFRPEGSVGEPIIVYLLDLPPGFPTSRGPNDKIIELREDATLTGFSYRILAYQGQRQPLLAPLVLAKSFQWQRPAPKAGNRIDMEKVAIVGGATALAAIALALWLYLSVGKKKSADEELSVPFKPPSTP